MLVLLFDSDSLGTGLAVNGQYLTSITKIRTGYGDQLLP